MPIYEYVCGKCKENFALLQKMDSSEKDTTCPKCGSKDVRKKFSLFSCSLKGNAEPSSAPSFSGGS